MIDPTAKIHPLAVTDASISVGPRSRIWQFATVIRGAKLGADCSVAAGACFDGSRADDRVVICHNLAAGPGFWLQDDVFIGPNVTLCNDSWPRAHKEGFDPSYFDGTRWAIILEKGASVGAGAVILPGVRIGQGAMVAAGAVVARDVPAHHICSPRNVHAPIGDDRAKKRMRFVAEAGLAR